MMKSFPISIFVVFCLAGCADQITDQIIHYCSDGDYQNCDAEYDAGDCLEEHGCKHPVSLSKDTYLGVFNGADSDSKVSFDDGYVGRIDAGCRSLKRDEFGGDVDWIAIKAVPGTPLKIDISRDDVSRVLPVLYLHNRAGGELVYSKPGDYGFNSISFLAPDELFYVSVEEKANYDFDYQSKCSDNDITGGEDYTYLLKVTNTDLAIQPIGRISGPAKQTARFTNSGETHYYSISTGITESLNIKITINTNKPSGAMPVMSPLSSQTSYDGSSEFSWIYAGDSLRSHTSRPELNSVFEDLISPKYASCGKTECEYRIAVTDFNAEYDYEYELTVEPVKN